MSAYRSEALADEAELPLALLAGGLASRLGAMTERVPKSLLEVASEPFIAHQLRLLAEQGIRDIVICCGHLGGMIADFVGDGSQFGCRARYSFDGPPLLGTGGAIRKALPMLGPHFWVMYGDSYLPAAFDPALRAFKDSGKRGLMTVFQNDDRWDASNVEFDAGRIVRYSKRSSTPEMRHIDYGLGIYSAAVFAEWPEGASFDLAEAQGDLIARGEMAGLEVAERFFEIGSAEGLAETDAFLRGRLVAGAGVGA